MKDSIRKRIGRIIAGTFNSSLDSVEAGADIVVLEQTIRETDSAIEELIDEQNARRVDHYNATRRLTAIKTKLSELSDNLAVALEQDMEEHAKEVISSQIDLEKQQPLVEQALEDAASEMKEFEDSIEALKAKKREMQVELSEYRKMKAAEGSEVSDSVEPGQVPPAIASSHARRKAEVAQEAFNRVVEKKTGLPSGLSSSVKSAQALSELQEVSRKNRIDERLAAAKASFSGSEDAEENVPAPETVSTQG